MTVLEQGTNPTTPADPPGHDTSSRDGWVIAAVSLAVMCFLGTLVAVGIGWNNSGEAGGGGAVASGGSKTIEVTLGDLFIKPASIELAPGTKVTFNVTNTGAMQHDFKVNGEGGTEMLDPGKKATFTQVIPASTSAWCTVPGHKEAGMVMAIKTAGGSAATGATPAAGVAATDSAIIDPNLAPAPDWKPYDPALKPALGGTEHKIAFSAEEKVMEVAPGVKQELWVFNGQSPGPLRQAR